MTAETIQKCIESLEDEQQKDFIRQCLVTDPASRPKARDLLFHPVLFEVGRGSLHFETDCLLRFSVLIAFRSILSNFSPPTPLSRTQVWIDVNFLLVGCYWLLVIWTRRSNSSENSASFSSQQFHVSMMLNQFFFQSLTSVSSVEGFWCKVSFIKCSTSPQTLANSTHPTWFLTCDNVSIRF